MTYYEYFERNTEWSWSWAERYGFDDGYGEQGYGMTFSPQSEGDEEDYEQGFINGAYTRLNEEYPGIAEATAEMHTAGRSAGVDVIDWLFLPNETKLAWAKEGELDAYADALLEGERRCSYG